MIGISKVKRYVKELKAICIPGVIPFQAVLIVYVYVLYGVEIPVISKDERVKEGSTPVSHLPCVAGNSGQCHCMVTGGFLSRRRVYVKIGFCITKDLIRGSC